MPIHAQAEALGCSASTIPLAISKSDLVFGGELASGAEAVVVQGRWGSHAVAIKRFRIAQADDLERFRSELSLMATLRHPHIMPVLGARALPPSYLMVMPLAASNLHLKLYEQGWQPGWGELLSIGAAMASALEYVHSHGIVHRCVCGCSLGCVRAQAAGWGSGWRAAHIGAAYHYHPPSLPCRAPLPLGYPQTTPTNL